MKQKMRLLIALGLVGLMGSIQAWAESMGAPLKKQNLSSPFKKDGPKLFTVDPSKSTVDLQAKKGATTEDPANETSTTTGTSKTSDQMKAEADVCENKVANDMLEILKSKKDVNLLGRLNQIKAYRVARKLAQLEGKTIEASTAKIIEQYEKYIDTGTKLTLNDGSTETDEQLAARKNEIEAFKKRAVAYYEKNGIKKDLETINADLKHFADSDYIKKRLNSKTDHQNEGSSLILAMSLIYKEKEEDKEYEITETDAALDYLQEEMRKALEREAVVDEDGRIKYSIGSYSGNMMNLPTQLAKLVGGEKVAGGVQLTAGELEARIHSENTKLDVVYKTAFDNLDKTGLKTCLGEAGACAEETSIASRFGSIKAKLVQSLLGVVTAANIADMKTETAGNLKTAMVGGHKFDPSISYKSPWMSEVADSEMARENAAENAKAERARIAAREEADLLALKNKNDQLEKERLAQASPSPSPEAQSRTQQAIVKFSKTPVKFPVNPPLVIAAPSPAAQPSASPQAVAQTKPAGPPEFKKVLEQQRTEIALQETEVKKASRDLSQAENDLLKAGIENPEDAKRTIASLQSDVSRLEGKIEFNEENGRNGFFDDRKKIKKNKKKEKLENIQALLLKKEQLVKVHQESQNKLALLKRDNDQMSDYAVRYKIDQDTQAKKQKDVKKYIGDLNGRIANLKFKNSKVANTSDEEKKKNQEEIEYLNKRIAFLSSDSRAIIAEKEKKNQAYQADFAKIVELYGPEAQGIYSGPAKK